MLQLALKIDCLVGCNLRVSMCVTEQKNDMNVPTMFYTPQKEGFVENLNLAPGMG